MTALHWTVNLSAALVALLALYALALGQRVLKALEGRPIEYLPSEHGWAHGPIPGHVAPPMPGAPADLMRAEPTLILFAEAGCGLGPAVPGLGSYPMLFRGSAAFGIPARASDASTQWAGQQCRYTKARLGQAAARSAAGRSRLGVRRADSLHRGG